jgi:hypothetical protein
VQFEITEQTRIAIQDWHSEVDSRREHYLFPSRVRVQPDLSTGQYARIAHAWIPSAGLDSSAYGTHSMRRTKTAQIYKKTGNLRAVRLLLGHTKLENTVRYLGIEVDDALAISKRVELYADDGGDPVAICKGRRPNPMPFGVALRRFRPFAGQVACNSSNVPRVGSTETQAAVWAMVGPSPTSRVCLISRASFGANRRPRCTVERLSHITKSLIRQTCE